MSRAAMSVRANRLHPTITLPLDNRREIETAIEALLLVLDSFDPDADLEVEEDCCDAEDDIGTSAPSRAGFQGIGDDNDGEDGGDAESDAQWPGELSDWLREVWREPRA